MTAMRNGITHSHNLRRVSPVLSSCEVLRRSLRLTVAQRRLPSSLRTMIMERANNQIKPTVSSTIRVTPAARGSEPSGRRGAAGSTRRHARRWPRSRRGRPGRDRSVSLRRQGKEGGERPPGGEPPQPAVVRGCPDDRWCRCHGKSSYACSTQSAA